MSTIEVIPGAKFGALTVKGREGNFNGETTWRCEDEKGRSVVFLESEIVAMYVAPEEVVPDAEPEPVDETPEDESATVDGDPDTDCDEVPGGAAVAQSEPEQEEEKAEEETPKPVVEKKKSFSAKKIKRNKEEIRDGR